MRWRARWVGVMMGWMVLTVASTAWATPSFARKYETSCQTCHVVYPRLNAFGDAFRRNGYRYPAGEDEAASAVPDVALGDEAYKRVWPEAVWPGKAPAIPPIAATLGSTLRYVDGDDSPDFSEVGASIGLLVAGSLGDVVSGWVGLEAELEFEDGEEVVEVELERAFLRLSLFGEEPWVGLRIGRFELALPGFTSHRLLGPASWLNRTEIGDNDFTLGPTQTGFALDGVLAGRLLYDVGVVEGRGNAIDDGVDTFGRLAYKFGGMRADGVGGATSSRPWRDDHVTVGVFGLSGRARIEDETGSGGGAGAGTQLDYYARFGGSLEIGWWDLQLNAAYARSANDQPDLERPRESVSGDFAFTQLDWVAFPWLVGSGRWELRRIGDEDVEHRLIPAAYFLIRPNVRANLFAIFEVRDELDFDNVGAGIAAAF